MTAAETHDDANALTLCIIKPEALRHREPIWSRILASGLRVTLNCTLALDEHRAAGFYRSLPIGRRIPAVRSLLGGPVEIAILTAPDAVDRLIRVCGTHSVPDECEPGTIRRDFGEGWDYSDPNIPVLRNAIHRCKSPSQAAASIAWFWQIYRSQ
jgi:nucleoside diphosphate kinase